MQPSTSTMQQPRGRMHPPATPCRVPRTPHGHGRVVCVRAARGHSRGTRQSHGADLPSAQILERRAGAAGDPVNQPSAPSKAEKVAQFLRGELQQLFVTGDVTRSAYASDIVFEDPISRFTNLDGYQFMIRALKTLFSVTFTLHDVTVTAPDTITTRWTMGLKVWELPWQPTVLISGRSYYTVDSVSGLITQHKDTWDALDNNQYPSPEALVLLVRQVLDLSTTPDLESPEYTVLRVTNDYEVRRYAPFVVAEAPMGAGSSSAAGTGFNELAGYIFGGNRERKKMEMTTPVFSAPRTTSGTNSSGASMQFVIEKKMGGVDVLPEPLDSRVVTRELAPTYTAALRFGGFPLDFEVTAAERRLREALLMDGLEPKAGYRLARYNEPWQPLPFRRNEVLIDLQDFKWT